MPQFRKPKLNFNQIAESPYLLIGTACALALFAISAVYLKEFRSQPDHVINSVQGYSTTEPTPALPPADLKQLNILLVGHGGPGHDGGSLADAIIVVNFDFEKKSLNLISIPRDLAYTYPNGATAKINTTFARDLEANRKDYATVKTAASEVTGLPIDYLVAIDFVGFQRAIGINLQGINVEVKKQYDDTWYPIIGEAVNPCGMSTAEITRLTQTYSGFELEKQFPCRYKEIHYTPGIHTMSGGEALEYARSRHGSSDFDRSRRQREIILAVMKKLFDIRALDDTAKFFAQIAPHLTTDINLEILDYTKPALNLLPGFTVREIGLSTENVLTTASGENLVARGGWPTVHQYLTKELAK